jgi:thiol:disulfide interchange protein DsbD
MHIRNMKKSLLFLFATLFLLTASAFAQEHNLLKPDQAFPFTAEALGPETIRAAWNIAPKYHLYRNRISFETDTPGVKLGTPRFPQGKVVQDEYLGPLETYHGTLKVDVPVLRNEDHANTVNLTAHFQGCADWGVCYPPITNTVAVKLPGGPAAGSGVKPEAAAPALPPGPVAVEAKPATKAGKGFVSEQDRLAGFLVNKPLWVSLGIFFLAGLALAFTPCVFPMIPILSSMIIGRGERITTRHAFWMSLVYVLAMTATYTVAGIVVALLGANLQAAFQEPWVLASFSAVFVLLALAMFDFYELQMPSFMLTRLSRLSNQQEGGTLIGVAAMGVLSALIVGPCVAAPLVAALMVIGQSGDVVLGGSALFALGLGMGAPLLVIGTSAGKILPRAGVWMGAVKSVFGVVLLALAIWVMGRILPATVTMVLWAVLLMVSAVYMGALEPMREGSSGWHRLWKGLGLIMMVYGVLLMIGAAAGSHDYTQPLRGLFIQSGRTPGVVQSSRPEFKQVKSVQELEQDIAAAAAANRPVMLDFSADWCVSCQELEKNTFSDPQVKRVLQGVVLLQVDVTANNAEDKALLSRFNLIGPPAVLFFGPDGKERKEYRLIGYLNAEQFRAHVEKAFQGDLYRTAKR